MKHDQNGPCGHLKNGPSRHLAHIANAAVAKHVSHGLMFLLLYVIFMSLLASYVLMWEHSTLALVGIYLMPLVFAFWGHHSGILSRQPAPVTVKPATAASPKTSTTKVLPLAALPNTGFALHDSLYQTVTALYSRAQHKSLVVAVNIHTNVPEWVAGPGEELRHVLNTLLTNAVKHTDQGEISLSVKTLEKSQGNVLLRFQIKDTGVGMSPATQLALQKATDLDDPHCDASHSDSLAECRPIVEAMGGHLGISSQLREGTAIWFTVILRKLQAPELAA